MDREYGGCRILSMIACILGGCLYSFPVCFSYALFLFLLSHLLIFFYHFLCLLLTRLSVFPVDLRYSCIFLYSVVAFRSFHTYNKTALPRTLLLSLASHNPGWLALVFGLSPGSNGGFKAHLWLQAASTPTSGQRALSLTSLHNIDQRAFSKAKK